MTKQFGILLNTRQLLSLRLSYSYIQSPGNIRSFSLMCCIKEIKIYCIKEVKMSIGFSYQLVKLFIPSNLTVSIFMYLRRFYLRRYHPYLPINTVTVTLIPIVENKLHTDILNSCYTLFRGIVSKKNYDEQEQHTSHKNFS